MHFFDGEEWSISSAGGMTGEAYKAESAENKLFIKRNSSPFLAVLSAERIVPKLLWTRRLENGDVLTAQKWLNGRVLEAKEMTSKQVCKLLKKIHTSDPLVFMLSRLGKKPISPALMLQELETRAGVRSLTPVLRDAFAFLRREAANVDFSPKKVCHSDINHNNWLIDEKEDHLYLVDWDQAVIADPALDLAMLLYWYVEEQEWEKWLAFYGWPLTDSLKMRLLWYMVAQTVKFLLWHQEHDREKERLLFEKDLLWLNHYVLKNG